jgi:hypothetical protein
MTLISNQSTVKDKTKTNSKLKRASNSRSNLQTMQAANCALVNSFLCDIFFLVPSRTIFLADTDELEVY